MTSFSWAARRGRFLEIKVYNNNYLEKIDPIISYNIMVAKIGMMDKNGDFIDVVLMLGYHDLYDMDYDYSGPVTLDIINDIKLKISYLENFEVDDQTIKDDMLYPKFFSREDFDEELDLHIMSWRKVLQLCRNNPHGLIVCM